MATADPPFQHPSTPPTLTSLQPPDPPPKPIPPSPDPPPSSANPSLSPDLPHCDNPNLALPHGENPNLDPLPKQKWSSLFAGKPKNAGSYAVNDIVLKFDGENLALPDDIIQASFEQWNGFLVGFFLDTPLPYYTVINFLTKHWAPQGTIDFKSNGTVFFFQFSSLADRIRVLEADPVIIRNKLFIVKQWEPSLSNVANSVKVVPVWIKMFNIPLAAWSKRGISYMASRVGKFLCMDSNTESLNRLEFAKCMVEVSSNAPLPDSFPVRNLDGSIQLVKVFYLWKPEVCQHCKVFGHKSDKCQNQKGKESEKDDRGVNIRDNAKQQNKEMGEVNENRDKATGTNTNERSRIVIQRPRFAASNNWTKVVKRKSVVRVAVNGKDKRKQVSLDADVTSNSFSLLPVSDIVCDINPGNHVTEEGEILNDAINETRETTNPAVRKLENYIHATSNKQQSRSAVLQVKVKADANLDKVKRADQIAQVDEILVTAFGSPTANGNGGAKVASAIPDAVSVPTPNISDCLLTVPDKIRNEDNIGKSSTHSISLNSSQSELQKTPISAMIEKQKGKEKTEQSAIESARSAHIRTINADMSAISNSLLAELAIREVNSTEYLQTVKKQEYFKAFCSGIVFDQLNTAQLDSVSAVLQKTIESGKKKMRKSPIDKDKAANPYAHIAPPAAFKERPPDIINEPVSTSSVDKSEPIHITRSIKKELLRNLHENG